MALNDIGSVIASFIPHKYASDEEFKARFEALGYTLYLIGWQKAIMSEHDVIIKQWSNDTQSNSLYYIDYDKPEVRKEWHGWRDKIIGIKENGSDATQFADMFPNDRSLRDYIYNLIIEKDKSVYMFENWSYYNSVKSNVLYGYYPSKTGYDNYQWIEITPGMAEILLWLNKLYIISIIQWCLDNKEYTLMILAGIAIIILAYIFG